MSTHIFCNIMNYATINDNTLHQAPSYLYFLPASGVSVHTCDNMIVSCNNVKAKTKNALNTRGYEINMSTHGSYACNAVDSSNTGWYFAGSCLGSVYKGNSMSGNYVGAYWNTYAITDPQTHSGNMWLGNFVSGYDAVNMNWHLPQNLLASLITVDSLLPKIYKPTVPLDSNLAPFYADDKGWLKFFPGSKFECSTTNFFPDYSPLIQSKINRATLFRGKSSPFFSDRHFGLQNKNYIYGVSRLNVLV